MQFSSSQRGFITRIILVIFLVLFLLTWFLRACILPPAGFPVDTTFTIEKGDSLGAVAYRLEQNAYIQSAEAFKIMMLALGSEGHLSVGDYYFDAPLTMPEVALKISGKAYGILQHKVTIPEGFTNKEIAARLAATFEGFDAKTFLLLAKQDEGYLFPDTYSFAPDLTPEIALTMFKNNFERKIETLKEAIAASGRTEKDIIIVASIVEREAGNAEEAPVIAGILWKRLDNGIALQVDAPFYYLFGKASSELTIKDLAIDSPYNTYKYKGLPPQPIGNPGLIAIKAAVYPVASSYLYYLHDAEGAVHYASTHDEHVANKQKYLP